MRRTFSLPEDRSVIEMTEVVQAPLDRAWVARWEPLYVAQWWAPLGYTNPIVEIDLVENGRWRLVQRDPQGHELSYYGTFLAVEHHQRVIQTYVSELFPDVTTHITTEFAEVPRGTRIVTVHAFSAERERRGYVNIGGVERMAEASMQYDRLMGKLARAR